MVRRAPRHAAGIQSLSVQKADPKILQDFLAIRFSLTRRTAKAVIDGRNVWVNRKCVWMARFAIRTGDVVELPQAIVKAAQRQAPASALGGNSVGGVQARRHVRVLWQDDNYLVCDKPSGMVSCDDPKSVESLLREQEGVPTLEAVHRLDRDTTGCLLFAKRHVALEAAIEVFRTHKVTKIYHAIVAGRFPYAHQTISSQIDGQDARSDVTREAFSPDVSLLRVKIETGRTNQIRRHLSSVRFPIVGDRVFGLKSVRDPRLMQVPRQMLHASTLTLIEPMTRKGQIHVHSPMPADFRASLRVFGLGKK